MQLGSGVGQVSLILALAPALASAQPKPELSTVELWQDDQECPPSTCRFFCGYFVT